MRETSGPGRLYPLKDMHGSHIEYLPLDEAQKLLKSGAAETYGNKKRLIGIRLLVPVGQLPEDVRCGRAMTPSNYCGTRYCLKEMIDTPILRAYIWRLKKLSELESPAYALLRMLTAPALESRVYTPLAKATDAQRRDNPGKRTRLRNSELFRARRVASPAGSFNDAPAEARHPVSRFVRLKSTA